MLGEEGGSNAERQRAAGHRDRCCLNVDTIQQTRADGGRRPLVTTDRAMDRKGTGTRVSTGSPNWAYTGFTLSC